MRGLEWSDSALVLAVGRFREADMWVRLLTPRHGLVRAFAFGASRSRRRFSGCLDVLNFLRVRAVFSGNGKFLNLEEGVLMDGPRRLRSDLPRLGMAMNCLRFLEAMDPQAGQDGEHTDSPGPLEGAFELMRSLFVRLENEAATSDLLPVLFRLRLASDQGFAPSFAVCSACGESMSGQDGFFSIADGLLLCAHCRAGTERGLRLSAPALDALAHVQATLPEHWSPEALDSATRRECGRLVDAFMQYHLGLYWDRGRFRRG